MELTIASIKMEMVKDEPNLKKVESSFKSLQKISKQKEKYFIDYIEAIERTESMIDADQFIISKIEYDHDAVCWDFPIFYTLSKVWTKISIANNSPRSYRQLVARIHTKYEINQRKFVGSKVN